MREYIILPAILTLVLLVGAIGHVHQKDLDAAIIKSFNDGVASVAKPVPLTKEEKEKLALLWWVDTHDMNAVRERLCGKLRAR